MSRLIAEAPDASAWVEERINTPPQGGAPGRLVSAVIWTDSYLQDGEPIGGSDPSPIVDEINRTGIPLLHRHDPGRPAGRVIAARAFTSPSGVRFVAAILAYYTPELALSFAAVGIDPFPPFNLPADLPSLDGVRLQLGVDPRDVASEWLTEALGDTPIPVDLVDLSHNDAESLKELIRIGLPFAALVWNPVVKTIGEEAGKDIYHAIRDWLQRIWTKLRDLRSPIVELQARHQGCAVSFLFRGRDLDKHYAAHAGLAAAAAQAARLIDTFGEQNPPLINLFYEFEGGRWFPSYGIMADGRIVSDPALLIAFEQAPRGLSLGLLLRKGKDLEQ